MESNCLIRELVKSDEPFLYEMLYQALYVREGDVPFERNIVKKPELVKYVKDWGREHDFGLISVNAKNGQKIGAIWIRLLTGQEKGLRIISSRKATKNERKEYKSELERKKQKDPEELKRKNEKD